ncbi:MAG: 50S ribosomal protein L15 [Alphaproteobacteria bacterium]|nr:50S ribosomal protein L15 [Alphaproteobacteria bacterium]|tara:strand:- start:14848 stop:15465 length:618 start_codon:yes stop_codon:yes gene_type:complete
MKLNEISDHANSVRDRTRVGRGIGSGKGKRSGRGDKGQRSRSGVALKGFEGGQMPIHRRLPKRGFNNIFRKRFAEVNIGRLQAAVDAGKLDPAKPIDAATMVEAGIINQFRDGVRLLGKGNLSAKLSVEVDWATAAATTAVEKAGGSVTVLRKPKSDATSKKGRKTKKARALEAEDSSGGDQSESAAADTVEENDDTSDSEVNSE